MKLVIDIRVIAIWKLNYLRFHSTETLANMSCSFGYQMFLRVLKACFSVMLKAVELLEGLSGGPH